MTKQVKHDKFSLKHLVSFYNSPAISDVVVLLPVPFILI